MQRDNLKKEIGMIGVMIMKRDQEIEWVNEKYSFLNFSYAYLLYKMYL